jgi:PTH1 family peptidyl-tRNA hydrolase
MQNSFSSNDFEKIKIGIGRPNSKDPNVVADYVLKEFPDDHLNKIREGVYPKILKHINLLK